MMGREALTRLLAFFGVTDDSGGQRRRKKFAVYSGRRYGPGKNYEGPRDPDRKRPDPAILAARYRVDSIERAQVEKRFKKTFLSKIRDEKGRHTIRPHELAAAWQEAA